MTTDDKRRPHPRQAYHQLRKLKWHGCLDPSASCEADAIRAHSIQNSRVLDALCRDGHVVMPRQRWRPDGPPFAALTTVGRNEATTFTGLCAEHDRKIFEPIDTQAMNMEDERHLFLLAYRSVLRETHACLEAARQMQQAYSYKAPGRSPIGRSDLAARTAQAWMFNAYETLLYKREFDGAYLAGRFDGLRHYRIRLEQCRPSIGVSSLFSLDDMPRPAGADDVGRIVLNVFPVEEATWVLFSFLHRDADVAAAYLQRVVAASGHYQKYLVSKLVLQHCDNVVMAPDFVDQLTGTAKQRIETFFNATIMRNEHGQEDEHLYLFF